MRVKASAILVTAVLVGCAGDHPTAVKDAPTQAQSTIGITQPTSAIEALVAAGEAAWAAKDAATLAAQSTEDVEAISATGSVASGRVALQAELEALLSGPFASSTQRSTIRRVQFLTGTIAIVDLDVELTGLVGLPVGLRPTEPGILRTRDRWVVVKRGGEWEIVALQRTAIPPAS